MRILNTPIKTKLALSLAAALLLSACATTGNGPRGADVGRLPARQVRLVSQNTQLDGLARTYLQKHTRLQPVGEDAVSELNLFLSGQPATSGAALGSPPPIVGILRQDKRPTAYRLQYRLVDMEGVTLADGDVIGVGDDREGMFPTLLVDNQNLPIQATDDALRQVVEAIAPTIATQPWKTAVISIDSAQNQVTITAGLGQDIRNGQHFAARSEPGTQLEVVAVENMNGKLQVTLKLLSGILPPVGAVLQAVPAS